MTKWIVEIELDLLGLSAQDQQTVENALPVLSAALGHISANKQLFATLYADMQIILPAASILANALNDKGLAPQSVFKLTKGS